MTWYEQTRIIINDFMLNNNLNGCIDIIDLLFEYVSFDEVGFNCKTSINDNMSDSTSDNIDDNQWQSDQMSLHKYIETKHVSGEIKITPNDKLMHYIHVKQDSIPLDYRYQCFNEEYDSHYKSLNSIFEALCINAMSLNKITNCWIPVHKQRYCHEITFMDANTGHYRRACCKGHPRYGLDYFPLLKYYVNYQENFEEKLHYIKQCCTKWVIDRCNFRDKVLKLIPVVDVRDCVGYVKRFIAKLDKMDRRGKKLMQLNQYQIDYIYSLQDSFIAPENSDFSSNSIWYGRINKYSYDIVTWLQYNQSRNLFCQKNGMFIKRQKAKQIESKKTFRRKKYSSNCDQQIDWQNCGYCGSETKNKKKRCKARKQRRELRRKCQQWTQCNTVYQQTSLSFV